MSAIKIQENECGNLLRKIGRHFGGKTIVMHFPCVINEGMQKESGDWL